MICVRVKEDDPVFAEVAPGHDQVLWMSPHPCTQNASWSFRRWTWSDTSLTIPDLGQESHISPTT